MSQFFFEIYQEEVPARMQREACEQLKILLENTLTDLTITFQTVRTMVTPLRLIACVDGIAETSQEVIQRIRGPKENMVLEIIEKFKKNHAEATFIGLDGYIYAEHVIEPKATENLIPQIIDQILMNLSWSKTMRWPGSQIHWIRPIRRIYCQLDKSPLLFDVPLIGLSTSDYVVGHRFLSSGGLRPISFENYIELLEENYVMPDPLKRKQSIHDQLEGEGKYLIDQELIEENAGLVEWPIVYLGAIDKGFMHLPQEVLSTSMKVHQRYFTYPDRPIFGCVANLVPEDGDAMVEGYEKVLRARLADAHFFYTQDSQKPLEDLNGRLSMILVHKNIGTFADKIKRLESLMEGKEGKLAARLCKADLVSSMVYEFPELQGTMGRIYAKKQGFPAEVCTAIEQHYWPINAEGPLPTIHLAAELSFFDKMDTLLGLLGTGVSVSGSRDPLGLRRLAISVIRLIQEFGFDFDCAAKRLQTLLPIQDEAITLVSRFIKDRAEVFYNTLVVRGLMHLPVTVLIQRLPIVQAFIKSSEGQEFLVQYKRLLGLIKPHDEVCPSLAHPFEIGLNDFNNRYSVLTCLNQLLPLTNIMKDYFDQVKVLEGSKQEVNGRLTLLGNLKKRVDAFYQF